MSTTPTAASPLTALERSMGITSIGSPFDGQIDSEPDSTPPGRTAVQYGDDDALFDDANDGEGSSSSGLDMGSLDMTALGPGGDPTALIAQLEAIAASIEEQSGEPETEIRSKIALLRSVLDSRPAAVAQSRARMDAALRSVESGGHATPDAAAAAALNEQAALQSVCAAQMRGIEANLDSVAQTLQDDPAAAAMVASVLGVKKE